MSSPSATASTFQIGTYNYNTDTWTTTLDLNDKSSWYIEHGGLQFTAPEMMYSESQNIRTQGSNVTRQQYGPMHVSVSIRAQGSSVTNLLSTIHTMLKTIDQPPYFIRIALPGSSAYRYVQVTKRTHSKVPSDPLELVQKMQKGFQIDFTCQPGFMQGRQILHNLQSNPGAEWPSNTAIQHYSDGFTNFNAYASPYISTVLSDSPLAFYKTNETSGSVMKDALATYNGAIGVGTTVGQASFDGEAPLGSYSFSSSFANVPYTAALNTAAWTVEAWVKPTGGAGTQRVLASNSSGFNGIQIQAAAANNFSVQVGNGASFVTVSGGTATVGSWAYIVATLSGTTLTLYVNGSSVGTGTVSMSANTSNAWFFGSTPGAAFYWPGNIGAMAIYSTALSGARISAHYVAGMSGGALTQDKTYFPDVLASLNGAAGTSSTISLLRYFRCDEASGTTAYDASGNAANGTISATGVTLGVASLLTGDTDTCYTLASASSGQVTGISTTGLPTGNGAASLGCVVKIAGNPSATAGLIFIGTTGGSQGMWIGCDTTGHALLKVNATTFTASSTLSLNTPHLIIGTWDGTNAKLYVDNTVVASGTSAAANLAYGVCVFGSLSGSNYWNGQEDEVFVLGGCLTAAQVSTLTTAFNTNPSTNSTTMLIPSGGTVIYGSPAWTSYNPLQIPFRWLTGSTPIFYLHYTDSNNYLACNITGTSINLVNNVFGSATTVATNSSIHLINGVEYLLQLTQFPAMPQLTTGTTVISPQVQAVLSTNNNGSPGGTVATIGPGNCSDTWGTPGGFASTLTAQPRIAASGAALGIGGLSSALKSYSFGPGGWAFSGNTGGATGVSSGAWEQTVANCYSGGPVTSYGALRIDCPPAGTVAAQWLGGTASSFALCSQTAAYAIQGQQFGVRAWYKAPAIGNACSVSLVMYEYDSTGSQLTSGIVMAITGPESQWTLLSGTYTITNANTFFALMAIQVTELVAGASANATITIDNCQLWNKTTTGQTSMPYCETRMPNTPGQIVISGISGDMPAPAFLAVGTYGALTSNLTVQAILGRRATPATNSILVHGAMSYQGDSTVQSQADTTAWGGVNVKTTNGGDTSTAYSLSTYQIPSAMQGSFNLLTRAKITGSGGVTSVAMNGVGVFPTTVGSGNVTYLTTKPFTANSVWTHVDLGAVAAAPGKSSNLANLSGTDWYGGVGAQMGTTVQSGFGDYLAFMPTDAETHRWRIINGNTVYSTAWNYVYLDGTNGTTTWNTNSVPQMNYADAVQGGTQSYLTSVIPNGDTVPLLSPANNGLNQYVFVALDSNGNTLPHSIEVIYWPRDLYLG